MKASPALACILLAGCADTAAPPAGGAATDHHRQLHGLLEKFDRFDYNGDGFLSRSEIDDGIRDHAIEGVPDANAVIKGVDRDDDGRLSMREVQDAVTAQ